MQYFKNESPINYIDLIDSLKNNGNLKNKNKEMEW